MEAKLSTLRWLGKGGCEISLGISFVCMEAQKLESEECFRDFDESGRKSLTYFG